jgi:phenylalanyl-tRNA synthetase alpha chain
MTYRNDPYDPKQPSLLSDEALKNAVHSAAQAFSGAGSLKALGELKSEHLGDRSAVSLARREIGSLQPHAKAEAGKRVNEARAEIEKAHAERLVELEAAEQERVLREERVDVTLPWDRRPRGARHPLTTLMELKSSSSGRTSTRSTSRRITLPGG